MRKALTGLGFGVVFGFLLAWSRFTDPDVIRKMLLLQEAYMYLIFASAVAVGFVGIRLLRRRRAHALVTGEPIGWTIAKPQRNHVVGSVLFGLGWAVSNSCPGPIAAQLGQGVGWTLFTIAGLGLGVSVYARRQRAEARRAQAAPVPELSSG
jgi:uncharacterized membrane protein YedE/YeeE